MKILQIIYTAWCAFTFTISMIICAPFMILPILFSRKYLAVTFFFIRVWVYMFGYSCGIRFKGHNKDLVDRNKSYVFVINHTSFLDTPAIPIAIPSSLVGLGKAELKKIPIFSAVVSRWAVWVDRSSPESRKESVAQLKEILQGGTSVLVAPEGTRNNTGTPLLPFRYGPFKLAIESQINILPVVIHNADKLMRRGSLLLRPGTINTYCLAEISVQGKTLDDLEALTQQTHDLMKAKIIELNNTGKA